MSIAITKRLFSLIFILFSLESFAYDFKIDGIYYDILSNNEVYVHTPNGKDAMRYSGNLIIPRTVTDSSGNTYTVVGIGDYAFAGSSITSVELPNTIRFINEAAFMQCKSLKSIELPNKLESIGKAFISNSGITHIKIPNSVTNIANSAFGPDVNSAGCQLESIDLSELSSSITELPEKMFWSCHLKSIEIPATITTIGKEAFMYCQYIEKIVLPKTIVSIKDGAFYGCSSLKEVKSDIQNPFWISENVFQLISTNAKLYIPKGTKNKYEQQPGWTSNFLEIIEITSNYTVCIESSGNGSVSCGDNLVRNATKTYAYEKGTKIVLKFTPDNGYRISSILSNGTECVGNYSDLTKEQTGNISSISKDYNISVKFEAIPTTTHTLSIKAAGNGSASYNGTTIRSKTSSFSVNEGTSATISFSPDNGYRIKSVLVNSSNVTSYLSNNQYTINNISKNTSVEVEFEAIPATTYTLSIKATGYGSASYNGTTIRSKTSSFSVNEGTSATISFSPDNGYRIKSVLVNSSNVTSYVSNNKYTISSISRNTSVEVEFEAIPATTYTLTIKATGNGSASYNGTTIRSKTSSFNVNEGTSATISFSPDNGYRIKSVLVNSSNVTSYLSNNKYTISSISRNTSVEVEFEAIPATTYTLTIKATGNGSASYNGTTIRSKTSSFSVNEGSSVTISLNPDNGYRIKSVKENSTNVTSYVSNGSYKINVISRNTSIEVEFEAIPPATYTLSIKSTGSGYASYDGTTIRNRTSTFTVNEGTSATVSFSPDNGYKIKSVKVNNSTVSLSNNKYTISNINKDTSLEVEFEAITYTLSIKATGSGSVSYDGTTIRSRTSTFTVNEGATAAISFSPDNGYRVKSVLVNSSNVTASVSNNKYTISSISRNTTVEVEFEAIPVTTYTLSIMATGNGSASYSGNTIRNSTSSFTVNEGTSATISLNPDNGYRVKSLKEGGTDVTSNVSNNKYTISNIKKNTTIEVEFQEELKNYTSNGINYTVLSYKDKTKNLAKGNYGAVLEVPATITFQDITWNVAGVDDAALANNEELAAIIWNPTATFNVSVSNPNLLLYVKSASYAPATIKNVVVNSTAESIVLTDAASGNDFYCPKEFTARKISYTHNYGMITGIDECRGWETIALPFDVKKIAHSSKGELTPFANWRSGDNKKPFWLMSYGAGGWTNASSIKANTPYIISMPNNPDYKAEFRLSGNITFSADNVTIKKSDDLQTGNYSGNTFTPNFSNKNNSGYLTLNVNNDYASYTGASAEGSIFIANLRTVHPFEAYMTSASKSRSTISVNGDMTTGIEDMAVLMDESKGLRIYNLKGQLIKVEQDKAIDDVKVSLPAGVYIVNGKKLIIK